MPPKRVLFVCLGNICRSPLAWALAQQEAARLGLDNRLTFGSAGLGDWHIGKPADPRARAAARRHGLDLRAHRARQLRSEDRARWDVFVPMDADNKAGLLAMGIPASKIVMMRAPESGDPHQAPDVPDPYWGDEAAFEAVLMILRADMEPLLRDWLAAK
ncbi:MAG: low molecular weight phosphotyrosine protein phosphatase [Zetaproteobacteria bacterium]|nr:MAG: low molecular weight phosphotyrosine protein phosphatase [Zetaproteobacteria bacterium]